MEKDTIWTKNFIKILTANALVMMGMQMINTLVVPYALWLGTAATLAGIISGAAFAFSLIARPFTGVLANLRDRKRLYLLAGAVMLASAAGLIVSPSYWLILLFRITMGVGYSLSTTCSMVISANAIPEHRIGKGLGFFGISSTVGQMIGPGIGLFVAGHAGYRAAFGLMTGIFAAVILLGLALPAFPGKEEPFRLGSISPRKLIARESLTPASIGLLFSILNSSLSAFMAVYAEENGLHMAGDRQQHILCGH